MKECILYSLIVFSSTLYGQLGVFSFTNDAESVDAQPINGVFSAFTKPLSSTLTYNVNLSQANVRVDNFSIISRNDNYFVEFSVNGPASDIPPGYNMDYSVKVSSIVFDIMGDAKAKFPTRMCASFSLDNGTTWTHGSAISITSAWQTKTQNLFVPPCNTLVCSASAEKIYIRFYFWYDQNYIGNYTYAFLDNIKLNGTIECKPITVPTVPTGPSVVCQQSPNATYSILSAQSGAQYEWNITTGAGYITGTSSNAIVDWNESFSGDALIEVRGKSSCTTTAWNSKKVNVLANSIPPALHSKNPNINTICKGRVVSATFNPGSGGIGCSDFYEFSINNGVNWNTYVPGMEIKTDNAITRVMIQSKRGNCNAGAECSGTEWITLAQWMVNNQPAAAVFTKTPNTATVTEGGKVSASLTSLASGGTGCYDSYQYRYNQSGNWLKYTSGTFLSTTGCTTVEIKSSRGNCQEEAACIASENLYAWIVEASIISQPANKNVCAGDSVTFSVGASGFVEGFLWQKQINNIWQNIAEDSIFSGVLSNNLRIRIADTSLHGTNFRCIIKGKTGLASNILTSSSASLSVYKYPPRVSFGNDTFLCKSETLKLKVPAGYTYKWSTGESTSNTSITTDGSYSVTITNNQCSTQSDTIAVKYLYPYSEAKICLVTIDTGEVKYKLTWEKTKANRITNYKIYKLEGDQPAYLGTVEYHQPSWFIDTTSLPYKKTSRYVISVVDSCGNESGKSPFHENMFLQEGQSANNNEAIISWTKYVDESGDFIPSFYYIYKGKSRSEMVLIDSIAGNMPSHYADVDFNGVPSYYQIGIRKTVACVPGGAESMSNIILYKIPVAEETVWEVPVSVYPNPFDNTITIHYTIKKTSNVSIEIMDMDGKKEFGLFLRDQPTGEHILNVDTQRANIEPGLHYIKVIANNKISILKCVKY